ncbi:uncharacterized protein L3040_000938 [Drepanopeziza brunnea f. sp. 'multigermtubi']|uniref:CBR-SET-14 protein n=1 Tax=Marssonina brunnea f. sp. multigermtubi (strain MB_m1) TaxID=1072389 RepID=K1XJG2_MARBU|nr:CBR-SET-14 protein [Drepanopeziza brunnea f. sp. 'multigermtubi' MB_m1]EKD20833.1 CBR-SET-14 protein [Drepanopeziza brunnea f. sp. 'multigermtubi' MB_m1]KAJ5054672.1 hypothetical protein L3040_000938 [Drepanopeziza brunnea f. sp. 'multigermtubi']
MSQSLEDLVRAFNALPRSPKTPSGLVDNHWYFAIRRVPLEPPGDLLHVVNPGSRYNSTEGPTQILSYKSLAERADIVLPMLLRVFMYSMSNPHQAQTFAPWSWGTDDVDLAKALEQRLKLAGVCKELCVIKVGDEASSKIEQEIWDRLLDELIKKSGPQCDRCNSPPTNSTKLLRCGGCRQTTYCSKTCQKADWKDHKAYCQTSAIDYWKVIAPNAHDAIELAAEIGLKLGSGGLVYPIRRLVVTGKDTPENFRKLLGWNDKDEIKDIQHSARKEVLIRPPKGSPDWAFAKGLKLDENCPPWTPRPASVKEEQEVREIKEMQELIKRHMGSRSMSTIGTKDMTDFLAKYFPRDFSAKMQTFTAATNAMDQDVMV